MKRENRRYRRIAACLAVATFSCLAAWALAQQPGLDNRNGGGEYVLLLRNGRTLQGTITVVDDRYQVAVPGGEILVKQSEVLCCCRDLREVYEHKRNISRLDNVQDRLDLAQWCQQVGLLAEAADELSEAMVLDPTHPLIPVVDRRLKVAAAHPETEGQPGKPVARGPSNYELDLMVRGMPPGTVETFTQVVQPMLMNSCAAAGCHGQASTNGFRLLRVPPGGPPSRRLTQRNLYAALEWVDRSQPGKSPLLAVPARAHGTARAPVFTDHQVAQYRQLVEWCYRVAQAEESVKQVAHHEPSGSRTGTGARGAGSGKRGPTGTFPSTKSPVVPAVGIEPAPAEGGSPSGPRGRVQRGATVPKFTPTDPFDPEAFNRQFAPAPEGEAAGAPERPEGAAMPAAGQPVAPGARQPTPRWNVPGDRRASGARNAQDPPLPPSLDGP